MTKIYAAGLGPNFGGVLDPQCPQISSLLAWPLIAKGVSGSRTDYITALWQQTYIRSVAIDSGAFTFRTEKRTPDVADYIRFLRESGLADHPKVDAIFGLDVIGDWRQSKINTDRMIAAGINAIPTWHAGSPFDVLVGMSKDYPRIAIGGFATWRPSQKLPVVTEVFSRVWPCRIHGFGFHTQQVLDRFPFDSVDASTQWLRLLLMHSVKVPNGQVLEDISTKGVYPKRWATLDKATENRLPMPAIARWVLALEHKYRLRWGKELARWSP